MDFHTGSQTKSSTESFNVVSSPPRPRGKREKDCKVGRGWSLFLTPLGRFGANDSNRR